jgi:hypothetical protein
MKTWTVSKSIYKKEYNLCYGEGLILVCKKEKKLKDLAKDLNKKEIHD